MRGRRLRGGIERSDLHAKPFAYLEDKSRKFSEEIMQKDTERHLGGHLKRQLSEIGEMEMLAPGFSCFFLS
jgi:hypothetical protein